MRHVDIKTVEVGRGRGERLYPPGMPPPTDEGAGAIQHAARAIQRAGGVLQRAAGVLQRATSGFQARMLDG
jgi:hypothetical protein